MQRTPETLPARASLPLVTPQYVRGTDEPVFVRHVQGERITVLQHAWTANQRYIVEVDDIELSLVEKRANGGCIDYRPAGLLRHQNG